MRKFVILVCIFLCWMVYELNKLNTQDIKANAARYISEVNGQVTIVTASDRTFTFLAEHNYNEVIKLPKEDSWMPENFTITTWEWNSKNGESFPQGHRVMLIYN